MRKVIISEEAVLPYKQRNEEITALSEKIVRVIVSEKVTMDVAERALDKAKSLMHAHTIAKYTCQ